MPCLRNHGFTRGFRIKVEKGALSNLQLMPTAAMSCRIILMELQQECMVVLQEPVPSWHWGPLSAVRRQLQPAAGYASKQLLDAHSHTRDARSYVFRVVVLQSPFGASTFQSS